MRVGLAASTVLHSSVLVFMLVSFTGAKPFDTPPESMPVDIVSASEFTKMTKGEKSGKKDEAPKTVAEKVDAPSPVEDSKPKVSEKAPVDATTPPPAAAAPPPQPPQPPQQQPTPPKAAEAPPTPPTADEALKNAAKPDPKPVQQASLAPVPLPPRKPAPPKDDPKPQDVTSQRDFNADEIKQLLDKRTPTRQAASASQVSTTASLGAPRGEQATLSQSEIDAFRARLQQCWITPGVPDDALFVLINVSFREDGSIVGQPEVLGGSPSAFWRPIADSAMRALLRCQPYTMLRKENYRQWKDMELRFTPKGA